MRDVQVLAAEDLPPRLAQLPTPPSRIWLRGTLPSAASVAIVGTRRADLPSLDFARALARDLGHAGLAIVSGGAEGIDAEAHLGALEAGASTLVVLPTPIARPYPRHHLELFDRVIETGGGWVSERAPDERSHRGHFLSRNRLIAAFADAVVVAQAPARSGALSTARWARRLGRPLFAVPASPWDLRSAGTVELLRRGARPCTGAVEVASALGCRVPSRAKRCRQISRHQISVESTPSAVPEAESPGLNDAQRTVLQVLGPHPKPIPEIVELTGLSVVAVRVALVRLAASDLADQRPAGWLVGPRFAMRAGWTPGSPSSEPVSPGASAPGSSPNEV